MNKRQAKKKRNYRRICEDILGYVDTYSELKKDTRYQHKTVAIQHNRLRFHTIKNLY